MVGVTDEVGVCVLVAVAVSVGVVVIVGTIEGVALGGRGVALAVGKEVIVRLGADGDGVPVTVGWAVWHALASRINTHITISMNLVPRGKFMILSLPRN
jgi:hypothetical protein